MEGASSKAGWTEQLQAHCAGKPGAVEDQPWENHVAYKVGGKIFAIFGAEGVPMITVKADPAELDGLLALPIVERAPYVGRFGWVRVTAAEEGDLDLMRDLIDTSYRLVGPKRARR